MDIRTEAAIAAFVPSLLWLALVYSRDRYEKEPKRLVAKCYALSIVAVAMAFVLESLARPRLTGAAVVVIGSALVVGLIEEGSKFAVLVLGTRPEPEPQRTRRRHGLRHGGGPRLRRPRVADLHPAQLRRGAGLPLVPVVGRASGPRLHCPGAGPGGQPRPHGLDGGHRLRVRPVALRDRQPRRGVRAPTWSRRAATPPTTRSSVCTRRCWPSRCSPSGWSSTSISSAGPWPCPPSAITRSAPARPRRRRPTRAGSHPTRWSP